MTFDFDQINFEEFSYNSKSEWLERISRDLKGDPIEDLIHKIADHIEIDPFSHSEDLQWKYSPLKINARPGKWQIGYRFHLTDPIKDNQYLLNQLAIGVNSVEVELTEKIIGDELDILFQNIHLDFIDLNFLIIASDHTIALRILNSIAPFIHENKSRLRGTVDIQANGKIIHDINEYSAIFKDTDFRYLPLNTLQWNSLGLIERIASILKEGHDVLSLQNVEENFLSRSFLSIELDHHFFLSIAQLRAFRILLENLQLAYQIESPCHIPIRVSLNQNVFNGTEEDLIRLNFGAISAVLGGADTIVLNNLKLNNQKGSLNTSRFSIHIQNILKMESFLDQVQDPLAGSYFIEQLTHQITSKSWDLLINKLKSG